MEPQATVALPSSVVVPPLPVETPPINATPTAESRLVEILPTPILFHTWSDGAVLAADLREVILKKMERSPGVTRTNQGGGWHSDTDLQTWPEPCVADLNRRVLQIAREMVRRAIANPATQHLEGWRIEAWANVNGFGASNRSHDHVGGGNMWSGIFYVDTGGADSGANMGGLTRFEDRSRVPATQGDPFHREYTIVPQVGLMVLFPATLRHYVQVYRGQALRITIAFNLAHPRFVIPKYEDELQAEQWWWKNFRGVMRGIDRARRLSFRRHDPATMGRGR